MNQKKKKKKPVGAARDITQHQHTNYVHLEIHLRPCACTPVLSSGPSVLCCMSASQHLAAETDQCLLITKGPKRWSIQLTRSRERERGRERGREAEMLQTVIDARSSPVSLPTDVSLGLINPAKPHSLALQTAV